jgi:hypothetical protein
MLHLSSVQGVALALGASKQPLPAYRGGAYQTAAAGTAAELGT